MKKSLYLAILLLCGLQNITFCMNNGEFRNRATRAQYREFEKNELERQNNENKKNLWRYLCLDKNIDYNQEITLMISNNHSDYNSMYCLGDNRYSSF